MKTYLLVFCFSAAVYLTSGNAVSFITKCSDDQKCLIDSTQVAIPIFAKGIPELGVEVLDPLSIKTVDASSPNLKLIIKDITVNGTSKCKAVKVERDVANSKLHLHFLCTVKMTGLYDMKGKLLFLPIEGNGEMHANLNKILIMADVDLEEKVGKDSEKHWNIKKWQHKFELQDKSTVEFTNLFGGNDVLAKAVKDLIAENGNDIITEVGPKIIEAVVGKVAKTCNNFFHAVALKDLVLR